MTGAQLVKRIPRIKFPRRHPGVPAKQQPNSSGVEPQQALKSEVPAQTSNAAVGGRASLQPRRTPISEKEIESILLGGC
ncbi:uncharacterized protein LOC144709204 [Wolffia australiana]